MSKVQRERSRVEVRWWPAVLVACSACVALTGSAIAQPSAPVETTRGPTGTTAPSGEPLFDLSLDELLDMEVIIASGSPEPLKVAPATLVILTEREIRLLAASSIPDLLRIVAGLDVMAAWDTGISVGGRGLNTLANAKMLVLVDGVRLNSDFSGEVRWKELPVQLEDIERIEISLSPLSALYGANAFGGIIHIVTKPATRRQAFRFGVQQGNKDFTAYELSHSETAGKLAYSAGVSWGQTEGWGQRDPNKLEETVLPHASVQPYEAAKIKDWSRLLKASLRMDYAPDADSTLTFSGGLNWGTVAIPSLLSSASKMRDNHVRARLGFAGLQYHRDLSSTSELSLATRSAVQRDGRGGGQEFRTQRHGVDARYAQVVARRYRLTGGVVGEAAFAKSPTFRAGVRARDLLVGAYGQGEATVAKRLKLVAGARFDKHSDMSGVLSPRGSVVLALGGDHHLQLSAGRAFRKASFLETYANDFDASADPSRTGVLLGQLEVPGGKRVPERISYYNAGYQGLLAKSLLVRASVFRRELTDLITLEKVQPFDPFQFAVIYSNVQSLSITGGEVSAAWSPADVIQLFANASYQHLDFDTPITTQTLSVPETKGNLGLLYSADKGAFGSFVARYVGAKDAEFGHAESDSGPYHFMRFPAHVLLDANLAYELNLGETTLELGLSVLNILDKRHLEYAVFDGASKYFGFADPADNWTESQKRHYENRNNLNDRRAWAHATWRH